MDIYEAEREGRRSIDKNPSAYRTKILKENLRKKPTPYCTPDNRKNNQPNSAGFSRIQPDSV